LEKTKNDEKKAPLIHECQGGSPSETATTSSRHRFQRAAPLSGAVEFMTEQANKKIPVNLRPGWLLVSPHRRARQRGQGVGLALRLILVMEQGERVDSIVLSDAGFPAPRTRSVSGRDIRFFH